MSNPFRDQLRDSKERHKRINYAWWMLNNTLLRIDAEIGRIERHISELPPLRAQKEKLESERDALGLKRAEEETWQENLKAKLHEQTVAKEAAAVQRRKERAALATAKVIARSIASDSNEDSGGFRQ